ncbi:MAG: hypothetical protein ABI856_16920, partial [Nitrospira sp.]
MKRCIKGLITLLAIGNVLLQTRAECYQPQATEMRKLETFGTGCSGSLCNPSSKIRLTKNDDNERSQVENGASQNDGVLFLRQYQQEQRVVAGKERELDEGQVLRDAMKQADLRESMAIKDYPYIRDGVFRYQVLSEWARWERTREVMQRIKPGIDEVPEYLEQLARQAASIEMVLSRQDLGGLQDFSHISLQRILIGTVPDHKPSIETRQYGDYYLVILSDSFFSFIFQAAESVVLSWRYKGAEQGFEQVFNHTQEDLEEVLKTDAGPMERLYGLLHRWLFTGLPHSKSFVPPSGAYRTPWGLLVDHAQRFAIAHEYGHIANKDLRLSGHEKELAADRFALKWEAISSDELDLLPPNVALQGGIFYLTALDIVHQAVGMYQCGHASPDRGSERHPPLRKRIQALIQA